MSSEYEEQQVETTRVEKVLAVVMVIFLLIGGGWVLDRLEELPERPNWEQARQELGIPELQQEVDELQRAVGRAAKLEKETRQAYEEAQTEYEFRREEYRTALDAGEQSPDKQRAYEEARETLEERKREHEVTQTLLEEKLQTLKQPREGLNARKQQLSERMRRWEGRYDLWLFLLRFGYAVPIFGLTVYGWQKLRAANNRYLIVGTAFVAAAGLQLAYVAVAYAWDVFKDFGPVFISIVGTAISIAGIVTVRRYLFSFERVSQVRLRSEECPYCGFPRQHDSLYCVNCGERQRSPCEECGEPAPLLLPYCPHCGAERSEEAKPEPEE
jgi:hypothetical protein